MTLVINSHSCCQSICPGERQTSDDQIIQIHKSGGLIGLMMWDRILNPNGYGASLDDILKHINHVYQLTGCVDNIAIGSSMDGGFGSLSLPKGMKDIGDLPEIANWLKIHSSFTTLDIEKLIFRNWERLLRKVYT
jgi:membrane dipeptidase